MNAPSFLPAILSTLMILLAGYGAWRLAIARAWGRTTDVETDALHLAVGVAAAGLLASWAHTLPTGVWAALFAAAGLYFAARAAMVRSDRDLRSGPLGRAVVCAVLVYCFLAGVGPSTLNGSTAGQYTMAGMPGMIVDKTISFPALGLLTVAGLAFYAVAELSRLSPETEPGSTSGSATAGAMETGGAPARLRVAASAGDFLAPRSVQVCRVALLVVLAYAILSKVV